MECWLARLFGNDCKGDVQATVLPHATGLGNVVNACEYHAGSDWCSGKACGLVVYDANGRIVRELPARIDGEG